MTTSRYSLTDPAADGVFRVLSHGTRRRLVRLLHRSGTISVDTAIARLVEARGRRGVASDRDGEEETLEAALHHVHLPTMARAGVIDYEPETGRIRANELADVAYEILAAGSGRADG